MGGICKGGWKGGKEGRGVSVESAISPDSMNCDSLTGSGLVWSDLIWYIQVGVGCKNAYATGVEY